MALSIKTDEADGLARELAAVTGESLTEAVTEALRERLARVRASQRSDISTRLQQAAAEYAALTVADPRPADRLIGYDDAGLPV